MSQNDQKHKANQRLEAFLLKGLQSGTATPMTDKDWQYIRQAVRQEVAKKQGLR